MKKILLLLFAITFIACEYTEERTITLKSDTFISPGIGEEVTLEVQETDPKGNTTVYTKKLTIICKEDINPGHWKGIAKDDEGFYFDVESKQEAVIVNGKMTMKQITTIKLSKIQYPYTPNC